MVPSFRFARWTAFCIIVTYTLALARLSPTRGEWHEGKQELPSCEQRCTHADLTFSVGVDVFCCQSMAGVSLQHPERQASIVST